MNVCRLFNFISYIIVAFILVVFATTYYNIVDVAKLQKEQTILIHAASGGVG